MPRGDALCARSHLEEESTFLVSRKEMMAKSRHTWSRVIRVKSRCAIVENLHSANSSTLGKMVNLRCHLD